MSRLIVALRKTKWLQSFRSKVLVAKIRVRGDSNFNIKFYKLLCLKCRMMELPSQNNGINSKLVYLREPSYKDRFQEPSNGHM